jgi:hypothetical protein
MRKSIEESLRALEALDLSQIKRKLMCAVPEGDAWTEDLANIGEKWYKRFLEVNIRFPEHRIVPNLPIDMMWHQHILDTRAYARDCEAIFGEFMHHNPYFGMNGDALARDTSFEETNAIYQKLFGEDCRNVGAFPLECSMGCGWVDTIEKQPSPTDTQPQELAVAASA